MSKEISLKKIREIVMKKSTRPMGSEVSPSTDLLDEGYLDSFSVMQLVQSLEEELDIVFDYSDLRRDYFSTLESIYTLLNKKYGLKSSK